MRVPLLKLGALPLLVVAGWAQETEPPPIPPAFLYAGHEALPESHSMNRPLDGPVVAAIPGSGGQAWVFENATSKVFLLNYAEFKMTPVEVKPSIGKAGGTRCMAVDREGALLLPDANGNRVWRILPDGTARVIAGNGRAEHTGDGLQATAAGLDSPTCTATDPAGNLYIAESLFVRKVDTRGIIVNVAGCFEPCGRGTAGTARTMRPRVITSDVRGNIYIAESRAVWVLSQDAQIVRIPQLQDSQLPGVKAPYSQFDQITGIAVSPQGEILVADSSAVLWRIGRNGFTSHALGRLTMAPNSDGIQRGYYGNGPLTGYEHFSTPASLTFDDEGKLLIADGANQAIRLWTPGESLVSVAGQRLCCYREEGTPATLAKFEWLRSLASDGAGNIYVADPRIGRVRKIDPTGAITTVLGNGSLAYRTGVPALESGAQPYSVAVDSKGNLYVAEPGNALVRRVTPDGAVELVDGEPSGEFPLTFEQAPAAGVAVGPDDTLYYLANCNVMRWANGRSEPMLSGKCEDVDGPLAAAAMNQPTAITVARDGTIYLAGIRKRYRAIRNGRLESLPDVFPAGTSGVPGGLWSAPDGLLYISDSDNRSLGWYTMASALSPAFARFPISSNYILPQLASGPTELHEPFEIKDTFLQGITTDKDGRVLVGLGRPAVILAFPKVVQP